MVRGSKKRPSAFDAEGLVIFIAVGNLCVVEGQLESFYIGVRILHGSQGEGLCQLLQRRFLLGGAAGGFFFQVILELLTGSSRRSAPAGSGTRRPKSGGENPQSSLPMGKHRSLRSFPGCRQRPSHRNPEGSNRGSFPRSRWGSPPSDSRNGNCSDRRVPAKEALYQFSSFERFEKPSCYPPQCSPGMDSPPPRRRSQ